MEWTIRNFIGTHINYGIGSFFIKDSKTIYHNDKNYDVSKFWLEKYVKLYDEVNSEEFKLLPEKKQNDMLSELSRL